MPEANAPHDDAFVTGTSDFLMHHPLMKTDVILPTPQIAELCSSVYRAVMFRQLGLCFTAKSGMGKTYAIRYLATYLEAKIPRLVVLSHISRNHKAGSIRGFFKHFLTTVGHPDKKGETSDLRDRLTRCIVDKARISGIPVALMLIDEAQSMSFDDFNFLKDAANEIEDEGVSLITVLMAQEPDFALVRLDLETRRRLDLVSRFTLSQEPFRAFETLADLEMILRYIDNTPYFQTGMTWTESFLSKAFAHGFRLEGNVMKIFSPIEQAMKKSGLQCQLPARQLFASLRVYLCDAMAHDSDDYAFDVKHWKQIIGRTKLLEAAAIASAGSSEKFKVKS